MGQARGRSDGADGVRVVAGDHLQRDALRREVRDRIGGVWPQPLSEQDEGSRPRIPREGLAVQRTLSMRQHDDSLPASGQHGGLC